MPPASSPNISWYRTPLDRATFARLHRRSNRAGLAQALGYLGVVVLTGTLVVFAWYRLAWPWILAALFLHGTVFAFQINAVHELTHGTVFRTKWLHPAFARVFAFLGWINHEVFQASHVRHHRYTLHAPDDLEVVLPVRVLRKNFFAAGFVNLKELGRIVPETIRIACGRFATPWELALFPADEPALRRSPMRWSRFLLAGHGAILAVAAFTGWWWLPLITTLAPFYGGWLFFLCNNTQHIGLQDNVTDFRLCCRTFTVNPLVQFLYWHMNFHIEHHMYAAVPCYRLGALHRAIRHDLAPCPAGLAATWREIAEIQRRQETDPSYQYVAPVPAPLSP
jgi:fatty acid desaturase